MLDTSFPRPPGDVGNPASWAMPVLFATIPGATARLVVDGGATEMVDAFVAGARHLASRGAVGLITSCGFLAAMQPALARCCPLPVATSALLQIPMLQACMQGKVGVITYDAQALTAAHFRAVGADPATPVVGLPPDGAFHAMIERRGDYDPQALQAEVIAAAHRLLAGHPGITALVLECTNLPPFSPALRAATGLAVYDVLSLGHWFYAGLTGQGHPPHV
jgi:hypothetical protein